MNTAPGDGATAGPGDYALQFNPGFALDPDRVALVVVDMHEGTARDAADRGYRCVLIEDGCGAASQRLHDATCENFQRLLGRVETSETVLAELESALGRRRAR
jgi:Isochorismatase family